MSGRGESGKGRGEIELVALGRCTATLLAGLAMCVAVAASVPGCRKGAQENRGAISAKPDYLYVIRGKVVELPDPAKPTAEFRVMHEAIDNFADKNGTIVGMGTMEMPFPPAKGVSLEGVGVGDIVEIEFAVWYKPTQRWNALSVKKLPADTKLEFRQAKPPP